MKAPPDGGNPVNPPDPLISEHPKSVKLDEGLGTTLVVSTVGDTSEHTFQWYRNGSKLHGAEAAEFVIFW